MSHVSQVVSALQAVNLVLAAVLALRLFWLGLYRRFAILFSHLIFSSLRGMVFLPVDRKSVTYFYLYTYTQPIVWVFYVLLILEVCSLVLARYRGLRTASLWVLSAAGLVALGAALLLVWAAPGPAPLYSRYLLYSHTLTRSLTFSLSVFLLLLLGFLTWYPIPMSGNLVVHCRMLGIYFLGMFASFFAIVVSPQSWGPALGLGVVASTTLAFGGWLAGFRKLRETDDRVLGLRRPADAELRLMAQMNSLNQTLEASLRGGK